MRTVTDRLADEIGAASVDLHNTEQLPLRELLAEALVGRGHTDAMALAEAGRLLREAVNAVYAAPPPVRAPGIAGGAAPSAQEASHG